MFPQFTRAGDQLINLSNVSFIELDEPLDGDDVMHLRIYFVGSTEVSMTLTGSRAQQLLDAVGEVR